MTTRFGRTGLVLAIIVSIVSFGGVALASNWTTPLRSGSSAQAQAQAAPPAPTPVTAACTSSSLKTIKVTWSAALHATSYVIYQSTTSSSSGFTQVATGITATTWTSATLVSGQYWYRVATKTGSNWLGPQSASTTSRTISSSSPNCS